MLNPLVSFFEYAALAFFGALLVFAPYFRKPIKYLLFAGIFCMLMTSILRRRWQWYRAFFPENPLAMPLLVFLMVCAVTILTSLDGYHSQKVFLNHYPHFLAAFFCAAALVNLSKRNLLFLAFAFLASGAILAVGVEHDAFISQGQRIYSAFGKRIPFMMLPLFITYAMPFSFGVFLFARHRFLKAAGLVCFILLVPCLILAGSRSAWVAVPVSLIFLSFFKGRRYALKISAAVLVVFVAGCFLSGFREKLQTIPHPSEWNYRAPLFNSAVSMFRDRPVIGAGLGMFENLVKTKKYALPDDYPNPDRSLYLHAHSLYLEVLAENGIIGLASLLSVFAVYFLVLLKRARSIADPDKLGAELGIAGVVIATLVFGVSGSVITVGVNEAIAFWFLFGMGAGLLSPKGAQSP